MSVITQRRGFSAAAKSGSRHTVMKVGIFRWVILDRGCLRKRFTGVRLESGPEGEPRRAA
jgi:hypothetical protein